MATARLLIVDDEPAFLRASSRILVKSGYDVVPALDAKAALEILACGPKIDLVISDVIMPGMRGPELLENIRRASPQSALMLMSATPDAASPDLPFLEKPFRSAQLIAAVEQVLAEASMRREELHRPSQKASTCGPKWISP